MSPTQILVSWKGGLTLQSLALGLTPFSLPPVFMKPTEIWD